MCIQITNPTFPMKKIFFLIALSFSMSIYGQSSPTELSAEFLEAVRTQGNIDECVEILENYTVSELSGALSSDDEKKAFWINVYNGFVVVLLRDNPELYNDRGAFFSEPSVTVAGQKLSFDDIEHGILRRSKVKLSYGYLGKVFVDNYEKKMRVSEVDWRIHFALNCGAASCPPVEVYHANTIESQLQNRAKQYLTKTTKVDSENGSVEVTTLMNWFRADFGSEEGTIKILKSFGLIPESADPDISFSGYDWTIDVDNFTD